MTISKGEMESQDRRRSPVGQEPNLASTRCLVIQASSGTRLTENSEGKTPDDCEFPNARPSCQGPSAVKIRYSDRIVAFLNPPIWMTCGRAPDLRNLFYFGAPTVAKT